MIPCARHFLTCALDTHCSFYLTHAFLYIHTCNHHYGLSSLLSSTMSAYCVNISSLSFNLVWPLRRILYRSMVDNSPWFQSPVGWCLWLGLQQPVRLRATCNASSVACLNASFHASNLAPTQTSGFKTCAELRRQARLPCLSMLPSVSGGAVAAALMVRDGCRCCLGGFGLPSSRCVFP